jgi:energy-coupling factor transport system ATP-binding protein
MLDPKGRKEVLEVVDKLNKEQGVTVLTITHYMDEVVHADKVVVLENGKIAMFGTPEQIFKQKEEIKRLGLELPLPTIIADKLMERGLPICKQMLTEKELSEELCRLK